MRGDTLSLLRELLAVVSTYCIGETYDGAMSDDFEAHPTNINAAEAAETTLRIFLNPQAAD